jgi:lysophospholipase L1-like esterase
MKDVNNLPRQGLINWILLLVVLLLCFAVMEAIFRVSSLGDRLGWAAVSTVPERVRQTPPKTPDDFRIMGLGDSFTIYRDGQGKNYLRIMEKLANQSGQSVEVVNLGRPGMGLDFYEGVARKYLDVLKPDLITVGLYLGDDIPATVVPPQPINDTSFISLKEKIKNQSKLLNYSYRLLKQVLPVLQSGHYAEILSAAQKKHNISNQTLASRLKEIDINIIDLAQSDAINPWDLVNGLILPNHYYDLITQNPNSASSKHIDALITTLKRFDDFAQKRGVPVVFITIPIRLQVSEKDQAYFKKLGLKTGKVLIGNTPLKKKIADKMSQNGLNHFDMLPALMDEESDLFIPLDTHLNNAGQVVAGTHLYHYLKKQNIFKK